MGRLEVPPARSPASPRTMLRPTHARFLIGSAWCSFPQEIPAVVVRENQQVEQSALSQRNTGANKQTKTKQNTKSAVEN
jgi:hypothetical protein